MTQAVVLGANGATGRLLVTALLQKGISVNAVVRRRDTLSITTSEQADCKVIEADITTMSNSEWHTLLDGCDVVLSCLGHHLSFKGLFGQPRSLVTDAMRSTLTAINDLAPQQKVNVILMNTTGNQHRGIAEKPPLSQRIVVGILRHILPPHADNEQAAEALRLDGGHHIEWCVVRPDSLIDDLKVSDYRLYPSPIRNVIFDAGETSRINVADFMSALASDPQLWQTWQGKMPVIYNQEKKMKGA